MKDTSHGPQKIRCSEKGFTLIEILIGLGIMAFIFGGIYSAYDAQMRSYNTQNQVVDMHQNIRAAMTLMQKELRMAGSNPDGTLENVGFIANDDAGITTMSPTQFSIAYFSATLNPATGDEDRAIVQCAYRFNAGENRIERYFPPPTDSWQVVAENIDALDFRYIDEDNNAIDDNSDSTFLVTNDFERIHAIQIAIVARVSDQVSGLSYKGATDNRVYTNRNGDTIFKMEDQPTAARTLRRMKLSGEIFLRNIAYQ